MSVDLQSLKALVRMYGYDDVEDAAVLYLVEIAEKIVVNIMRNVCAVASVCKVKNAKEEHFKLVSLIQSTVLCEANNSKKKGGRIVLPEEYFSGEASGKYYSKEAVSPYETTVSRSDDPTVARSEIPIKVLGGKWGSEAMVMSVVSKMQDQKKITCGISKDGVPFLESALESTMASLMAAVRKLAPKSRKLLKKQIVAVVTKKPQFAHLC
jgi:hypothetical protein